MTRRLIILISSTIVVVLLLIIAGVFVIRSQASATGTVATPTIVATPTKQPNPYTKPLHQYSSDIKNHIAQGVKLTPDQLTSQLQSGKTLTTIATTQGLSAVDFQNLIANTLDTSLKPAVTSGELTQEQVTTLVKRMQKNPKTLQNLLAPRAKATPQPAGTPGK